MNDFRFTNSHSKPKFIQWQVATFPKFKLTVFLPCGFECTACVVNIVQIHALVPSVEMIARPRRFKAASDTCCMIDERRAILNRVGQYLAMHDAFCV